MKRTILAAFLTATLSTASAQSLRVGYYGETVTHYGLRTAYEQTVLSGLNENKGSSHILYAAVGLAVYRHPHNHIGLILSPELGYRRTGRRGGLFEVSVAPAYFRYFLDGQTYRVNKSGDFERVRWAGGNAFLPTVSVGIGRDLSVRRNIPLAWYTRLNLMQQRPYNTSRLTRFSLEAGALIPLKGR
ncbi:MAG: hypothetical protein MUD08_05495 [Cytophagales bacterium]|jgi:hypothetical protein|nr:hypothetical protein [Cytophagales bacterium]